MNRVAYGDLSTEWKRVQFEEFIEDIWSEVAAHSDWSEFVKAARGTFKGRKDMQMDYKPVDAADYINLVKTYNKRGDDPYTFSQ